ncbi:hypothetical protein FDENT_5917 [Fusarium denticulatum]|uniref:BZIP domain-containing protein n=1 Tax=Fusarium denticulatum TaxID=48507 RepID=A0A8H5U964_9HYPO|nr:hypothetical protein FDENT_5917 [Fusarium denticulatum]
MDETGTENGRIAISAWNGSAEWRRSEDDWTGVSTWQERRKIQNRLSQRARRGRRRKDQSNNSKPFEEAKDKAMVGSHIEFRQPAPSDQEYASSIESVNHVDVQSVGSLVQLGDKDGYRILPTLATGRKLVNGRLRRIKITHSAHPSFHSYVP